MEKVFIIAEIGNSHEGSVGLAKRFIKTAADCGADAAKFQTHIFDAESLPNAPTPSYFKDESRKEYFERTAFDLKQYKELKRYTEEECGIEFISSVFSLEAVDLLEHAGVKRHKIPSGEVTNIPLLEKVASIGKPVLLSSGMSTWSELDKAIETLKADGCRDITVLQCSSFYPCPPEKAGLNILTEMKNRYNLAVGFSDHSLGISASIGAVMLGAEVIERHFTLSKEMYGSDAKHSLEPDEFKQLIKEIREIEKIISSKAGKDKLAEELKDMKVTFEKSIVTKNLIPKGTKITLDMIAFKKPGDGIKPDKYKEIIGRIAKLSIAADMKITMEMLA
ncbi:MAG: N-acetylneuraminate synthase family protein [Phycisphaerae bacterium]